MDVSFKNAKIRKAFKSERSLSSQHGSRLACIILDRLRMIEQAPCLADVPRRAPTLCHQLKGDRDEQFAVSVGERYRLVFEVDHDPIPRRGDGGIDLEAVTAVVVTEVVDYHRGKRKR